MAESIFAWIGVYVVVVLSMAFLWEIIWSAIGGKERP